MYAAADPLADRLRALVALVKHWAAQQGFADPRKATLSSYALTLLAISYCQSLRVGGGGGGGGGGGVPFLAAVQGPAGAGGSGSGSATLLSPDGCSYDLGVARAAAAGGSEDAGADASASDGSGGLSRAAALQGVTATLRAAALRVHEASPPADDSAAAGAAGSGGGGGGAAAASATPSLARLFMGFLWHYGLCFDGLGHAVSLRPAGGSGSEPAGAGDVARGAVPLPPLLLAHGWPGLREGRTLAVQDPLEADADCAASLHAHTSRALRFALVRTYALLAGAAGVGGVGAGAAAVAAAFAPAAREPGEPDPTGGSCRAFPMRKSPGPRDRR